MPTKSDYATFNIEPVPGVRATNTVVFSENNTLPPGSVAESSVEKKSNSWKDWIGKKTKKITQESDYSTVNKAAVPALSASASVSKPAAPFISYGASISKILADLVERTAQALNGGLSKVADDYFNKAMEEVNREMLKPKPDTAYILDKLGELCLNSKEVTKAVKCFEYSLHMKKLLCGKDAVNMEIGKTLYCLGNAWSTSKNHQRAIVVYEKAIKCVQAIPNSEHDQKWSYQLADIYQNMGKCWEQLNEHKMAIGCYGKAQSTRRDAIKPEPPKSSNAPQPPPHEPPKFARQKKQGTKFGNNLSVVME